MSVTVRPILGAQAAATNIDLGSLVERLLGVVGIVLFGLILYSVGRVVIRRMALPKYEFPPAVAARAATTRSLVLSAWRYAVTLLVLGALLAMVRPSLFGALALTGVVGLVVVFAAQVVFRDLLGGLGILLEGQFTVGDRVRLFGPDVEGVVEGVGLRVTVVREQDGSRVFVPNGSITAVRTFPPAAEAERPRPRSRGGRQRPRTTRPRPPAAAKAEPETPARAQPETPAKAEPETPAKAEPETQAAEPEAKPQGDEGAPDSGRAPSTARRRSRRGGRRRSGAARAQRATDEAGAEPRAEGAKPDGAKDRPKAEERSRPDDDLSESPWSIE